MNSFDLTHALHGINVHKLNWLPRILAIKFYWSFPHHYFLNNRIFVKFLFLQLAVLELGFPDVFFLAWFDMPTEQLPARLVTCTLTGDISAAKKMGHIG